MVSRRVRVVPYVREEHGASMHAASCGAPYLGCEAYDPNLVWEHMPRGPFDNAASLEQK